MDDTNRSCREFVNILASSAPAPGGGGAAALTGAVGAALGHMVGSLTVGKKKYASIEGELRELMARCDDLQTRLLDQVEGDARGFLPLAAAYAIPKDDPHRARALEEGSVAACAAPLEIMELCGRAVEVLEVMGEKGSPLAISDAGCGAAILAGAMRAASLNVFINTKGMSDREKAGELNRRCAALLEEYLPRAERVFETVKQGLLP